MVSRCVTVALCPRASGFMSTTGSKATDAGMSDRGLAHHCVCSQLYLLLLFKHHIDNLALKISRHIALLYQIKDFMPQEVLRSIYYAYTYSSLTYCNPIWSTTYPTYLTPLILQQKKIVRIITNSTYLEHTTPLFKQTKLLRLCDITKLTIATFMYTTKTEMSNLLPSHHYSTRHRDNLSLPIHQLQLGAYAMMRLAAVAHPRICGL